MSISKSHMLVFTKSQSHIHKWWAMYNHQLKKKSYSSIISNTHFLYLCVASTREGVAGGVVVDCFPGDVKAKTALWYLISIKSRPTIVR